MLLADQEHRIKLRPLRYQFPEVSGDEHDNNWLIVSGEMTTPDGSWSFTEPCLLVGEALQLSAWLRTAAATPSGAQPNLDFTEPLLRFNRMEWQDGCGRVRIELSHEAAPPWRDDAESFAAHVLEIKMTAVDLGRAADEWDRDLVPFPAR